MTSQTPESPFAANDLEHQPTLFGHPTGLFVLFFAEMWERFSFYGMRALLVFYMIKGFLKYGDNDAYAVYGAYTALVYATPFIGGMLADRLLGARRAVILGGILMAGGHLLMTVQQELAFFGALALIICGNGFFKPNISTMVGMLYPEGSTRRDSGFTLFYMGINLGAAMAPLLCGYIGETFGWHYGFGLATVGMLTGLAVFWAPVRITQALILAGALVTTFGMIYLQNDPYMLAVNSAVALGLLVSAGVSFVALGRGGLPAWAGAPPDPERLKRPVLGLLRADYTVYLCVLLAIPVIVLLVQRNTIAGIVLFSLGGLAFLSLVLGALRAPRVERERLLVVLILTFFAFLFWTFFEQAGSSINNFTDRNVDRVMQERVIAADEVGQTVDLPLHQGQLGMPWTGPDLATLLPKPKTDDQEAKGGDQEAKNKAPTPAELLPRGLFTLTALAKLQEPEREAAAKEARIPEPTVVKWRIDDAHVGMEVGGPEIKASVFQSANPIFILTFGLLLSWLWGYLARRGRDPSTSVKFGLGLVQLGLGFGALWYGASQADPRGMVAISWLLLGYLLHTTGELCLSPVGLSMVTRLSPARLVSTVMGAWFLATALSQYVAALIAQLTGVGGDGDTEQVIPPPQDTVGVYGGVFGQIAIAAIASGVIVFLLAPMLTRWTHEELEEPHEPGEAA